MMSIQQCREQLSSQFPSLNFNKCVKYSQQVFIFADTNSKQFDAYIAIDRATGKTMHFVPTMDLPGFMKAFRERSVTL